MAFPFHCRVTILQRSISLVHGHYYLRGYSDLCPGKVIALAVHQTLYIFP